MLEAINLHISYGNIRAVVGVSLKVAASEIVSLIGANGAGKTTTLLAFSGILPLVRGKILLNDLPLERLASHKRVLMGLSHVPEGRRIFPHLTVFENLKSGAIGRSEKKNLDQDIQFAYKLFPVLMERHKQLGGTLSGGEQQMLAIARALMTKPGFLLLDEPSLGLAPTIIRNIFETFYSLKQTGIGILMVEQNARTALQISERAYIIETGSIVSEGEASTLLMDENIKKAYLGY